MGREKAHRTRKDHDHRSDSERPASTDVADLDGADHAASRHQRDNDDSEDLRFGEGPVAYDAGGRILGVQVTGGMSKILIGLGKNQGIHVGMEGYIKDGDGMAADFQIEEVKDRASYAKVDLTPDAIQETDLRVVVNPTSMPKSTESKKNMKSRVIGVSIEQNRTKITIALGKAHGARAGMKGYLVNESGARVPGSGFEVEEEGSRTVKAFVDLTIDTVQDNLGVVLNPG